jgi:hypothetical protein
MHVMRGIHAQKNLALLLRHKLPRRSGGVPGFRPLDWSKAMITVSKNRILAAGVLVTAVTLLVLSSTARPVLGRADEQAKTGPAPHYSVVMTEAHNLLVTDNGTNKLHFYTIDKDKPIGSPLKLRASVDLTKVGEEEIKITAINVERADK